MRAHYIRLFLGGVVLGLVLGSRLLAQEPNFSRAFSLYSDVRAHRVGDILLIHIVEFSQGSHTADSKTEKSAKTGTSGSGTGALKFFPLFGMEHESNRSFSGKGNTKRTGSLRAKMTARIKSIDENGNYVIEGAREVTVNDERMMMTLTGLVRPQDITAENVVYSYQIADAKITYKGKGNVHGSQKPGWITRILGWIF